MVLHQCLQWAPAHRGGRSGTWSARLAHEGGTALLEVDWSLAGVNHNGLLIHDLTGGVGEGRQGQGDPLQLPLAHFLLVLGFQVLAPGGRRGRRQAVTPAQSARGQHPEARQGLATVTARQGCSARLP